MHKPQITQPPAHEAYGTDSGFCEQHAAVAKRLSLVSGSHDGPRTCTEAPLATGSITQSRGPVRGARGERPDEGLKEEAAPHPFGTSPRPKPTPETLDALPASPASPS